MTLLDHLKGMLVLGDGDFLRYKGKKEQGSRKMIQAWLVSVGDFCLFLAEFSIWLKQFILPLPLYVFAGAFLRSHQNYEKRYYRNVFVSQKT